jgi:hypothetical protein
VFVPDVITSLSHERVLVSEYVEGIGFDDVKALSQQERDRFGEIVFRFFLGSLYRTRHFSADPHPGNYVLMGDGRVAFLDFGMAKKLSVEQVDAEIRVLRAGLEKNAAELRAALADMGFFDPADDVVTAERVLSHFEAAAGWYTADRPFRSTGPTSGRCSYRQRPAFRVLRDHEAPDGPAGRDVRAPHGGAHAGGPRAARGDRELAPDRPRVALRRPARDGAR